MGQLAGFWRSKALYLFRDLGYMTWVGDPSVLNLTTYVLLTAYFVNSTGMQ